MGLLNALGEAGKRAVTNTLEGTSHPAARAAVSTLHTGTKAGAQLGDILDRSFIQGRELLRKYGAGELADLMDGTSRTATLRAGESVNQMHAALKPFEVGSLKYNKDDLAHIVDVMEMAAKPKTQKHQDAANALAGLMDAYGTDAEALELPMFSHAKYETLKTDLTKAGLSDQEAEHWAKKGASRKFMKRENYFPHYFDELTIQKYLAGGKTTAGAVDRILESGMAANRDEALVLLKRFLRAPAESRGGPLAYVRDGHDFLTDYDKDPVNVLTRYFHASARRIETARTFGRKDELAMKVINGLSDAKAKKNVASLYKAFVGDTDPSYKDLARFTGTFHALTLLSTSGIMQPAQLMNTIAKYGWGNTLKGIGETAKDWRKAKLFAGHAGATFDNIHKDFMPGDFGGLSDTWTRIIGLQQLDKVNRVASAMTGRFWASEVVDRMARGVGSVAEHETWSRELQKMGINPQSVVGGKLTHDQERMAGLYAAQSTQFASDALDLPELRNTPQGRFLYLFKSFGFQQTYFVKNEIMAPAERGDYRPLLRFLSAASVAAPVVGETVRYLKHRETPDDVKLRVVEDLAMVGTTGMFFDAFRAMSGGPSSIFSWALGPTAGETAQLIGSDLYPAAEGLVKEGTPNFKPLVKHMTSRVPLAGPWLKETLDD